MKRVLVIGSCGAGKSTFARRLHELTDIPLIPLDRFYWKPGWVESPAQEWEKTLKGLISGDKWIIDGNYGGSMAMRLERADTVFWLDLPRYLCVYRVLKRSIFSKKNGRPDMADGCVERFDWEFIKYVWNFRAVKNPKILSRIGVGREGFSIHILKSNAQVSALLSNMRLAPESIIPKSLK